MAIGLNLHRFANPGRFLRLADRLLPWLTPATVVLLAAGLYLALVGSPPDYQQGETVRIMYVHVPAAWMAMFRLCCAGRGRGHGADLAPPALGSGGGGDGAGGRRLHLHRAGHRLAVGAADVGRLLGVGTRG